MVKKAAKEKARGQRAFLRATTYLGQYLLKEVIEYSL